MLVYPFVLEYLCYTARVSLFHDEFEIPTTRIMATKRERQDLISVKDRSL